MKKKTSPASQSAAGQSAAGQSAAGSSAPSSSGTSASWFEYVFPLLPLLALIPNFFIIPGLTYAGLATQEVGFAAAVMVCAVIGLAQARRGRPTVECTRQSYWLFAPLTLFVCWQALSLVWASERGEALRQLGLWFGFLVFAAAAWSGLRARAAWQIYYALLLLAAVLALSLWLEYRAYGAAEMQGAFFNHGITAELLATLWPLFACVFLFEKQNRVAVVSAALAMVFTTAALMLTLRRGALLGIVVASLLIFAALVSKQMKVAERLRVVIVVLALLVFILPLVVIKREAILTRLRGATTLQVAVNSESAELGLTSRAVTWLTALEMGKAHWLKGVGLGNYPARYAQYRRALIENPRYAVVAAAAETEDYDQVRSPLAHSEYLQLFAELGLIGVALYLLFWTQALRALWQARRDRLGWLAFGALCGVSAFGVSAAISGFAFRLTPGIFVLAAVLAMGWAVRDQTHAAHADFALPKAAVLGLWAFAALAGLLMLAHNYNVYLSQRTQGSLSLQAQLDFSFALDNAAVNETSVRRYQRILDTDPHNAGAHLGFGVLLFQMKRLPECLQHADYASQHGYGRPFTTLLRAFANEHNGAPAKAQEILREGLASFPKSIILRTAYVELLRKRGQPEEAQRQTAELEKGDVNFARSWSLVMRYKDEEATRLAKQNNLTPPGELTPRLARVLAQARAYHYFRSATPPPQ